VLFKFFLSDQLFLVALDICSVPDSKPCWNYTVSIKPNIIQKLYMRRKRGKGGEGTGKGGREKKEGRQVGKKASN
jgi:hypothetical protein